MVKAESELLEGRDLKLDKTHVREVLESSVAYWFRDYWSNRRRLGRNNQSEGLGWKENKEEFDIDSLGPGELVVERNEDGSSSVQESRGRPLFTGLVDPQVRVLQYEPYNILVRDSWGRTMSQTPQEWFGFAELLDSKIGGYPTPRSPPPLVIEGLVAHMKSNLKRLSLMNPLIGYAISFILLWLIFEYVLGFVFRVLLPWLEFILFPLTILTYVTYAYMFVFSVIDEMGIDVRRASVTIFLYDGKRPERHYRYTGDIPSWLGSKPYWVFRYLFLWRGELTVKNGFPLLHFKPDWERVEVWLDARSGIVEWIVTDYHWRELWYRAEPGLSNIHVWILPNFHTPRPLTLKHEGWRELRNLYVQGHRQHKAWKSYIWSITGKSKSRTKCVGARRRYEERVRMILSQIVEGGWTPKKANLRTRVLLRLIPHRISKYFAIATDPIIVGTTLTGLWWSNWRYPLGANSEKYKEPENFPDWEPAVGKQPSAQT
ncbi:MAG: hypothetical protein ACETVP_01220 [Candidatus Bathyarchaeia archaeon]